MFHRIIFLVLIVSSLFRNFLKSQCRLFSVVHEHRMQEYSKCPAYQTRLMMTHNKTTKKLNIINSFLHWSVTLFRTGCPYREILKLNKNTRLFWTFSLKAHYYPAQYIHRSRLISLNSPDIVVFSSWKRFIMVHFYNLLCKG